MSKIKYSFISWDCSYRNFFHLVDALAQQDYPKDKYELIYVEQRSKKHANAFNAKYGLPTLEDKYKEFKDTFNIKIKYLSEPKTKPYHLGSCNNHGLSIAKGEYIAVMDGDQLLPPDFIRKLDEETIKTPKDVLGVYRYMSKYPVGVFSYSNWQSSEFDIKKCLNACPDKYRTLPTQIENYGPMVLAHKKFWKKIKGYDTHELWSTSLSMVGADAAKRLSIASEGIVRTVQNTYTVHPWHPIGSNGLRSELNSKKFFGMQNKLMQWSKDNNEASYVPRTKLANALQKKNKETVTSIIDANLNEKTELVLPEKPLWRTLINVKYQQLMSLSTK